MAESAYEHILCEIEDGVMVVTMNRPNVLNAFSSAMGREMRDAIARADQDDDVRVVIVTGAGRAFCVGADLSAGADSFDTTTGAGAKLFGDVKGGQKGSGLVGAVYNCRKPSIVAFNGPAVGAGLTMTLPFDIRIASTTAKFGFVFARRGLAPEAGSAWFLPRVVGVSQALRWCLDGSVFLPDEALKGGLISEITEPENLLPRAREIALNIARNTAPVAAALTRQMMWRLPDQPDPWSVLTIDVELSRVLGLSPDVREGVTAFLEKRTPAFPGKASRDLPPTEPWWQPD